MAYLGCGLPPVYGSILSATPTSPNSFMSNPNTSLYQAQDSSTFLTPIPTCCTPQITFLFSISIRLPS